MSSERLPDNTSTDVGRQRKSWFDQRKAARFDICIEPQVMCQSPNRSRFTEEDEEESRPTLELTHFARPPIVEFGRVTVGRTKTCHLPVNNPLHDVQEVGIFILNYID